MGKFQLCKRSQITMEQGSSFKTAKIRFALRCDPIESIKDFNSSIPCFKFHAVKSFRKSWLWSLPCLLFIQKPHIYTKTKKKAKKLIKKCQEQEEQLSLVCCAKFPWISMVYFFQQCFTQICSKQNSQVRYQTLSRCTAHNISVLSVTSTDLRTRRRGSETVK